MCLLVKELDPELLADEFDDVQVAGDARPVPHVPLHQLLPDPKPCAPMWESVAAYMT